MPGTHACMHACHGVPMHTQISEATFQLLPWRMREEQAWVYRGMIEVRCKGSGSTLAEHVHAQTLLMLCLCKLRCCKLWLLGLPRAGLGPACASACLSTWCCRTTPTVARTFLSAAHPVALHAYAYVISSLPSASCRLSSLLSRCPSLQRSRLLSCRTHTSHAHLIPRSAHMCAGQGQGQDGHLPAARAAA